MKARLLDRADVLKIVDLLRAAGLRGLRPVRRARARHVVRPGHRREPRPDPGASAESVLPAQAVRPAAHRAAARRCGGTTARFRSSRPTGERKRAIFGIRSCDIAGHLAPGPVLPRARVPRHLLREAPREPLPGERRLHRPGARHRRRVLLRVRRHGPGGARPLRPAAHGPGRRVHGRGRHARGRGAVRPARFSSRPPRRTSRSAAPSWARCASGSRPPRAGSRPRCATSRRASILEKTWEEIGNRCLECGGCTYVCPACTCFTVSDRKVGPDEIERVRIWDACALGGFTRMAGGHNPRKAVHDRRNRRFFRKLAHYFIQRELIDGLRRLRPLRRRLPWRRRHAQRRRDDPARHRRDGQDSRRMSRAANSAPPMTPATREHLPAEAGGARPGGGRDRRRSRPSTGTSRTRPSRRHFKQLPARPVRAGVAVRRRASSPPRCRPARPRTRRSSPSARSAAAPRRLHQLKPGDQFAVRGPYGNGFPMEDYYGKNLVFVAGGIGLIPLRSCIVYALTHRDKYQRIQIFYGAKTPKDLMYLPRPARVGEVGGRRVLPDGGPRRGRLERQRRRGGQPLQEARRAGAGGQHHRLRLRPADHVPLRDQGPAGAWASATATSSRRWSAT